MGWGAKNQMDGCSKPWDLYQVLIPTSCAPLLHNLSGPHLPHSFTNHLFTRALGIKVRPAPCSPGADVCQTERMLHDPEARGANDNK